MLFLARPRMAVTKPTGESADMLQQVSVASVVGEMCLTSIK